MISQFLNKQGEAAIYIAKRFLALNTGDRIPNLSDMSAEAGFGAGRSTGSFSGARGIGRVRL